MDASTFEFSMDRPARATFVGRQSGADHRFHVSLHSSVRNPFQTWNKVVYRGREPIR